jgi:phosphoheptose isomerase
MNAQDENFLVDYMDRLQRMLANDAGRFDTIGRTRDMWLATRERGGTVIFVGNGGSAGICSHLAIDLSKNAKVPATCFNDASQITCLANDYGYEHWMAHALRLNAKAGDCLVAISSSGRSPNILNAVAKARELKLSVVTLSGMSADNPLRQTGDLNFWADSRSYNIVETAHQFWLMGAIDLIIGKAEYAAS